MQLKKILQLLITACVSAVLAFTPFSMCSASLLDYQPAPSKIQGRITESRISENAHADLVRQKSHEEESLQDKEHTHVQIHACTAVAAAGKPVLQPERISHDVSLESEQDAYQHAEGVYAAKLVPRIL